MLLALKAFICTFLLSKYVQSRVPFLCKVVLSLHSLVLWTRPTPIYNIESVFIFGFILTLIPSLESYWVSLVPIQTFLAFHHPYTERRLLLIQSHEVIYCLRQRTSSSTSLFLRYRCSSVRFMLRTANLL
jgi:hypothetical protein